MKKWRKTNMQRAEIIAHREEEINWMLRVGYDANHPDVETLRNKPIPPKILRHEAPTFYTATVATPSALLMTLIYGKDWMSKLEQLSQLQEARKNWKELNPDKKLPENLNDALAVR